MARQFFIIFGCLAIGEFIVWLTGIKLPSSIIGMLALTALLKFNIVELSWVQKLSEFLISNLGFFFVPPGVAIMLYLDLIQKNLFQSSWQRLSAPFACLSPQDKLTNW